MEKPPFEPSRQVLSPPNTHIQLINNPFHPSGSPKIEFGITIPITRLEEGDGNGDGDGDGDSIMSVDQELKDYTHSHLDSLEDEQVEEGGEEEEEEEKTRTSKEWRRMLDYASFQSLPMTKEARKPLCEFVKKCFQEKDGWITHDQLQELFTLWMQFVQCKPSQRNSQQFVQHIFKYGKDEERQMISVRNNNNNDDDDDDD